MSNDETQPVSGSRWEHPQEEPAQPAPQSPQHPVPTPTYAAAPPPNRNRGKLLLAGGAVGIALVAGTGGFALGHAAAGDGRDGGIGRPGFGPNGGPGPMGFPNNGQQQQPPGLQGGPDGQDGPGGFGPRDDGDDDQQLPEDGATEGSSNS